MRRLEADTAEAAFRLRWGKRALYVSPFVILVVQLIMLVFSFPVTIRQWAGISAVLTGGAALIVAMVRTYEKKHDILSVASRKTIRLTRRMLTRRSEFKKRYIEAVDRGEHAQTAVYRLYTAIVDQVFKDLDGRLDKYRRQQVKSAIAHASGPIPGDRGTSTNAKGSSVPARTSGFVPPTRPGLRRVGSDIVQLPRPGLDEPYSSLGTEYRSPQGDDDVDGIGIPPPEASSATAPQKQQQGAVSGSESESWSESSKPRREPSEVDSEEYSEVSPNVLSPTSLDGSLTSFFQRQRGGGGGGRYLATGTAPSRRRRRDGVRERGRIGSQRTRTVSGAVPAPPDPERSTSHSHSNSDDTQGIDGAIAQRIRAMGIGYERLKVREPGRMPQQGGVAVGRVSGIPYREDLEANDIASSGTDDGGMGVDPAYVSGPLFVSQLPDMGNGRGRGKGKGKGKGPITRKAIEGASV